MCHNHTFNCHLGNSYHVTDNPSIEFEGSCNLGTHRNAGFSMRPHCRGAAKRKTFRICAVHLVLENFELMTVRHTLHRSQFDLGA